MDWRTPGWDGGSRDPVGRTELPETGGWIYRYRDSNGMISHLWAPDMEVWAGAIADAIHAKTTVVSVVSNFAAATHTKQPVPSGRGTAA